MGRLLRVAMLSREYPPAAYGGLGTHVHALVPWLRREVDVEVHCFDQPRADACAHQPAARLAGVNPALAAMGTAVELAAELAGADVVHSHGWYVNMAGHLDDRFQGVSGRRRSVTG